MLPTLAIGLAIAAIACMIGGPLLAHLAILPPAFGLALFVLSALLGLGAMIAGGAAAITQQAYFPAMIGTLGCLPLVAVAAVFADALRYPAINDIATDPADPPLFIHAPSLPENAQRDFTFPEANAAVIEEHYPDVRPRVVPSPPAQAYGKAVDIATSDAFNWRITAERDTDFTFEAVATTRLFQWKDDVVVRIRPHGDGGSFIDVRSKSRKGKGDLGANARRIRHFLDAVAN